MCHPLFRSRYLDNHGGAERAGVGIREHTKASCTGVPSTHWRSREVEFHPGANGAEPTDVEAVSGPTLLKTAALENVKTWHFGTHYGNGRYETTFDYQLPMSGPQKVTFESFRRVEVATCLPTLVSAELLYQQLDGLQILRRNVRAEFLAESRKHKAAKLLRQIPCIGPIRAARLIGLMQTPHRFRSKRQLWTYSGLGIETHDSAQYRFVSGHVQRSKKPQQVRGLNRNHNHEMKEIFKSAATRASCGRGPFHDFYTGLLAKGMKPEMARLTLARKIAAITLTLWKKEERFDVEQLKTQAA